LLTIGDEGSGLELVKDGWLLDESLLLFDVFGDLILGGLYHYLMDLVYCANDYFLDPSYSKITKNTPFSLTVSLECAISH
jgi:hypothetical protein